MTHYPDTLGRPPIMRHQMPEPEAYKRQPCEAWNGERLIRAPKRKAPEPEPVQKRRLKTETRLAIVKKMHREGKDTQDMMLATGSTRSTITGDLKALGLYVKPTQMRGDEAKARAAYAQYLEANNMTAEKFTETNIGGLMQSHMRGDGLLFIREQSGATPMMLEKVTGLHRNTCSKAVKLAQMRRAAK